MGGKNQDGGKPAVVSPILVTLALLVTVVFISACTQSSDSCEDLTGIITHTSTELTGIKSISVARYNAATTSTETIDENTGTEFSNLRINIDLSWIDEQHRFRETNTFIYSLLDWFVTPAAACSFVPYYEEFQSQVESISIYSDSDFNPELTAGMDLTGLFKAETALDHSRAQTNNDGNNQFGTAKSYLLGPVWLEGSLISQPVVPSTHVLTVSVTFADGRTFDARTPEFLLSGI